MQCYLGPRTNLGGLYFFIICLFNTSSPLNSVGVLQHREVKGGCGHCQDPGEFCECLKSQLKPIHGGLYVEQLHTTFDFRSWFFKAGVSLTGLAASHHEPHATHAWHFQRRGALLSNVLCQNSDWLPLEPQAGTGISKHTIYETEQIVPSRSCIYIWERNNIGCYVIIILVASL